MPLSRLLTCAAACLLPLAGAGAARAGELPDAIWSGRHGGFPSITANAQSGLSITLPEQAIAEAGGGAIDQLAKNFLDTWGPDLCSGLFDFQSPHKRIKVGVAVMKPVEAPADGDPAEAFYEVTGHHDVTIDYQPRRTVTCVSPDKPSS